MDWSKYLSREFLVSLSLIVVATCAMFTGKASFIEWASASGGFVAIWATALTVQKAKDVA